MQIPDNGGATVFAGIVVVVIIILGIIGIVS
jgi:hypothetical protein